MIQSFVRCQSITGQFFHCLMSVEEIGRGFGCRQIEILIDCEDDRHDVICGICLPHDRVVCDFIDEVKDGCEF